MERHDLDEHGSFAWLAHPDEFMERASTAVALGGGGWLLVDPLDAPGLDEALAAGGEVRAVATLLNRHDRDAEAIAARHGAPRVFPRIMASRGAPIALPEVQERTLWKRLRWYEAALWLPDRDLLIAPEALGTAGYYRAGDERLAVAPAAAPVAAAPVAGRAPPDRDQRRARSSADRRGRRRAAGRAAHGPPPPAEGVGARLPLDAGRPPRVRVARRGAGVSRCGWSSRRRPCRPRAASPGRGPGAAVRCGCGCRR